MALQHFIAFEVCNNDLTLEASRFRTDVSVSDTVIFWLPLVPAVLI